ncbi:sugar ABC transporter ATP-binding protein [Blastococcus sp. BMG 814]|uniref:Sugar ABC transporter ATP-binding protein n=1 Tax=Blastococcus carthaginiensis TaxID=3050034 RepID=A0ABT9IEM6_9ACTN|nr:sugar ABC transporter ATP-binding protein [Blastococcus carthaginiensis]MDP5183642.1 sugar ABC transporter ATP-binding protein [Blastococcus carthaginiensis]
MYALEAQHVRKTYGGVTALADAGLRVRPGSVHALLGENGAGKSTLVKIITGAVRPDAGVLRLEGSDVSFSDTADAARHGVAVVSQELSLFPDLDVLSNLFPMREPRRGPFVDRRRMAARARPILDQLGLHVSLREQVGSLSLAQRQLLEVAKALITEPRVLILDEPTSALDAKTAEVLLDILRVLRDRQVAVVFVSHILEEVMQLCDEITVLRDGRTVLDAAPRSGLTIPGIVEAMLGERHAELSEHRLHATVDLSGTVAPGRGAPVRLEAVSFEERLAEVSLTAAPGEVVGLAGVAGAGHQTVLELVAGLRQPTSGRVLLPDGRPAPRGLRAAIGRGVALVTGDRRRLGLMLDKPIWENAAQVRTVALARDGLRIRKRVLRERAGEHARRLNLRTSSLEKSAGLLSGGNQQKVVLAKWLQTEPTVLLLDDPTRGVDIGAKAEMHGLVRSVADAGAVVLLCSTDLDELVSLCDRVLVLHHGRLAAELSGGSLRQHDILAAMNTGAVPAA